MKEKILAMGGPGSGKSYSWLKLASYFKDAQFYVIDTVKSTVRSLEEFPGLTNVKVYDVIDWPEYQEAQMEITSSCREGDWVVVDMVNDAWTSVQSYFFDLRFSRGMDEYIQEARKRIKEGGAPGDWIIWPVVNRLYEDFIKPLVHYIPAHLYMVSPGQVLSEDDGAELRELCKPYGIRPEGQKDLAFQVDTLFLLIHRREGYYICTVKDRGDRAYFDNTRIDNFAIQYGKEAGW